MNTKVCIGESSNLGKVCNTNDLAVPGQNPELLADYFSTPAPNTNVNFVEYKHRNVIGFR